MNRATRNFYIIFLILYIIICIENISYLYMCTINGFKFYNIFDAIFLIVFAYYSYDNIQILRGKKINYINIGYNEEEENNNN